MLKADDHTTIGWTGVPGFRYHLERSFDLGVWTTLQTLTVAPDAAAAFNDIAHPSAAFYLLRMP